MSLKNEENKVSHHPCVYQFGSCAYGKDCRLYSYPGDTCLNFLRGRCTYKEKCSLRHEGIGPGGCIEKNNKVLDGVGTVKVNKKLAVVERDESANSQQQRPTINEFINERQELHLVIDGEQDGTDMVYWEVGGNDKHISQETTQPIPLVSQLEEFPRLGSKKPDKSNSTSNSGLKVKTVERQQPAQDFQLSASAVPWTPAGVENPYSYATRASQQPVCSSIWGTAPPAQVVKSEEPPKQELHPCLRAFPTCKFGKECVYKNMPRDACIMDLRGVCKFGDDCRDKHGAQKIHN